MKAHLFGSVSSPGCAAYGLRQVVKDHKDEFGPEVAGFILSNFYVDDGLKSVATVEEAIKLAVDTKSLCAKGGLRLHKFVSNSSQVLDAPEDRSDALLNIDLSSDIIPVERALGIQWCIQSDSFQFRITLKDNPLTRRGVLSTVCSVYDPLGFIAPVILVGKQILQEMCRSQASWDNPLSDALKPQWTKWRESLFLLQSLNIPRCYKPNTFGTVKSVQLHHFSDASTSGYGQCSYLRLIDETEQIHCTLVMGKARVTPLRHITIPRLELTAALVSVGVSRQLQRELEYSDVAEVFWTDSKVVLGYICNDTRRFHVFVANRIQQIRDHTEPSQWRHVKTEDNPADEGSRGLNAEEFLQKSKWLSGPSFLWERDFALVEEPKEEHVLSPTDPEVKKIVVHTTQSELQTDLLERLRYFSDWHRARKAVAVCMNFKASLQKRLVKKPRDQANKTKTILASYQPVTVEDILKAETEIIKHVQKEMFADEMNLLQSIDRGHPYTNWILTLIQTVSCVLVGD